jgi:hypothetical protein
MSPTYCTNCGSTIAAGAFCTTCGTPLGVTSSESTAAQNSSSAAYQKLNAPKPVVASTNTLAIIALVTSLLGIHLAGIICGHIALSQIKKSGESGRRMALAGLIIGYSGLAVVVLVTIALVHSFAQYSGAYLT